MKLFQQVNSLVVAMAIVISIPLPGMSTTNTCERLESNRYTRMRDNGPGKRNPGYICYIVQDSAELKGALTLKHLDNQGDWDILVGTSFDPTTKKVYGAIDYKNNSASVDEILELPSNSYQDYVVVAFPTSNTPSDACLIFHNFNAYEIAGEAFGEAIVKWVVDIVLGDDKNNEYKDTKDRITALTLSGLTNQNPADVGYDLMLNEISLQLSNMFGGGSFAFDFGVSYFGNYLKEYGKFLFDPNMKCTG
ncbi:MAG: hypothetical protein F6K40_19850 [Okeania sp. SIO3I5]|uniref:hypothetical protein n=1 Tax=Okeania sp. SIO3I5 TaxID=2607805 RepID=UPI0013BE4C4D|nr:hypothetical protein [Okeania sp. SIO3I5]NEQ38396.1 hypothetical protein [Okeania sp. SIO3I5]